MKEKLGTMLFCLVFAIPFGGIGAGATWVLVKMLQDGHRAEQWVRVKANVTSFSEGGVNYTYQFAGKNYSGDRLGANPIGGTDNIDSWHNDMQSMLSEAKSGSKPITVWVNPDNPSESMVDRTIRWKLVAFIIPFAMGFGGVGIGALYVLLRTLFSLGSSRPVNAMPPGFVSIWIFAFFWNVISFPIAIIAVPEIIANKEWVGLLVLLFPLIGVLMLWSAISSTITAIKMAFARRMARAPDAPLQPVAAAKPVNDGVFARGMLDDPRASAAAGDASVIDTADDGTPPPVDPAVAEWAKLADGKLSPEARKQLENMSPGMRALTGKLAGWLAKQKEESKQ